MQLPRPQQARVLGVMTGTSCDGIDLALLHFQASGVGLQCGYYSMTVSLRVVVDVVLDKVEATGRC